MSPFTFSLLPNLIKLNPASNMRQKQTMRQNTKTLNHCKTYQARVAELADALDLGSSTARCRGSNPLSRTIRQFQMGRVPNRTNRPNLIQNT